MLTSEEPNVDFEAHHCIENHIASKDHEGLMRSFTKIIDETTHPDAVIGENGIHQPSAKPPHHWFRRKISGWAHKHLAPEGFRVAVEKKYGNFVVIRSTNEYHYEEMPIYTRVGMHLLFSGYYQEKVVSSGVMHSLFLKETLRQGTYFTQPESVKQIPSFVQHYSIDMGEYVVQDLDKYENFNQFFTRAILPEKRPIHAEEDKNVIVSAADCRLSVFSNVNKATTLWIKGKNFTLPNLLQNEELAEELEGGSIAVFRLAPQDYHRFHTPAEGHVISISSIKGTYYTVNPCTVNEELDVFTENKRSVATIKTDHGFNYALVSIGALLVGSIVLTNAEEDKRLKKGEEMGYFQYGGSTVIAVFPKDTVEWDEDLLSNSDQSVETLVQVNERIGQFINKI